MNKTRTRAVHVRPFWATKRRAESLMDYRISRAVRCEEKRDASPFESPAYWRHHDEAIKWHGRAERLMPKSSRTISV